ncbi:MAG: (d)CMP kinase [Mycoplasmataceae bacterium]|jgi:cytidylate kinase|nr:(d)CMP kinase [Mycoplasmataceae bacterium]
MAVKNQSYIIAIDGPAGAGKSTVAKEIAKKLDFLFLNSGALYRCLAIALKNIDLTNTELVNKIVTVSFVKQIGSTYWLNNVDVSEECYKQSTTDLVPIIAKIPSVVEKILYIRQEIGKENNLVTEGRETTSVVFPNATLKVYMDASIELRAKRRHYEIDTQKTLEEVMADVAARDKMDMERKINPLIRVKDAFYLKTDEIDVEKAVDIIIEEFKKRI